jgi:hypothetical protein
VIRARKGLKEYGRYGAVGLELVLSIIVGYWLGHWADVKWLGGKGYGAVAGFLIGVYAGFRGLWVASKRMQKDIERAEKLERGEDPWGDDDK